MMPSNCLFLLVLGLGLSGPAAAEIYKWVDPDGETHYTERKPEAAATVVETVTPTNIQPRAERETWQTQNEAFSERRKDARELAEKDSKTADQAAKTKRNCEQANLRVATMERPRVNQVSADGTRARMPDEWRQAQLKEARAAVDKYCK